MPTTATSKVKEIVGPMFRSQRALIKAVSIEVRQSSSACYVNLEECPFSGMDTHGTLSASEPGLRLRVRLREDR